MKALFEQVDYEEMRNRSWADLMEEEAAKSSAEAETSQTKESMDAEYVTLDSDYECPGLSASTQPDVGRRKTSKPKKKHATKPR